MFAGLFNTVQGLHENKLYSNFKRLYKKYLANKFLDFFSTVMYVRYLVPPI